MESFKNVVDEAMKEQFDDYYSYYDIDGALNLDISAEGISDVIVAAINGDQECIDAWNEMIDGLVTSNISLIDSAKLFNIEDPSIIINIINDANRDKALLCIKNGEILYDALTSGQ